MKCEVNVRISTSETESCLLSKMVEIPFLPILGLVITLDIHDGGDVMAQVEEIFFSEKDQDLTLWCKQHFIGGQQEAEDLTYNQDMVELASQDPAWEVKP